jgi:hypothetical protein
MKPVRAFIDSNGIPYLKYEVSRIAQHVGKGEGMKEGRDG